MRAREKLTSHIALLKELCNPVETAGLPPTVRSKPIRRI